MQNRVSEQDRAGFLQHGYAGPFALCPADRMQEYRAHIETLIAERSKPDTFYSAVRPASGDDRAVETFYDAHLDHPVVRTLVTAPAIVDRAKALLSSRLLLWRSTFWIKPPWTRRVEWHQDTYKDEGLGSFPNINAWIAVDETTEENCVHLVKGSHERILPLESFKTSQYVDSLRESDALPPPPDYPVEDVIRMVVAPGEFFLFDGRILHGSPPNRSDNRRAGLVARFVPVGTELPGLTTPLVSADAGS